MTRARRRWIGAALALLALTALGAAGWLLARGDGPAWLLRRDATWARMEDDARFRVGVDPSFPPFEDLGADGSPQGFDVDLARALAARWGMKVEIVPIGFDSLLDALKAARIDAVISAMPFDERQTRDVAYSPPYFEAGIRLAVRAGALITDVTGLNGQRVAVEWGSAGDMIARRLQREQAIALTPVPFDTPADAFTATVTGAVDALLIDQVSLRIAQGSGAHLVAVGDVLESNPYVIVTPRRATRLAAAVSDALAAFAADGTLDQLAARWFGATPVTLATPAPVTDGP